MKKQGATKTATKTVTTTRTVRKSNTGRGPRYSILIKISDYMSEQLS